MFFGENNKIIMCNVFIECHDFHNQYARAHDDLLTQFYYNTTNSS